MRQIGSFAFHQSESIRRAMSDFDTRNQFREALKGFDVSAQMRGMFEAFDSTKKFREALSGFAASRQVHEAIVANASAFQALARPSSFEGINEVLKSVSPQNWPAIYESKDEVSVSDNGTLKINERSITQAELEQVLTPIVGRVSSQSVERLELKLAQVMEEVKKVKEPLLQKIVLAFVVHFIVGIILAVLGYGHYLERNRTGDERALRKAISKEVTARVGRDTLADYRYVKTAVLNVRAKSSSKASIVGNLHFGQVVELIERDDSHSWSRVRWTGEGEETSLEGWVFSRYLEKFK
jgi:SH3 domain-containing protein